MDGAAIRTRRLFLRPLTVDQLRSYLADPSRLEVELGVNLSRAILTPALERAIRMKIGRMASTPASDHLWLTYWLMQIEVHQFGAGMIGFKGVSDMNAAVEVGYGIDPDFQGRGYTTEALEGLLDWAFRQERCECVIAPRTRRENAASNRVLEKVGMRVYEQDDETRSWRLERASWQNRRSPGAAGRTWKNLGSDAYQGGG
jgi:ribosomal-protein-alanine N-acetyltransferase